MKGEKMRINSILKRLIVALPFMLLPVTDASAIRLYSLNMTTDELVTIDPRTGSVDIIGSLGLDVTENIELGVANNQLFAFGLSSIGAKLLRINTSTGGVVSNVDLTYQGSSIGLIESLTGVNDTLYLGFGDAIGTPNGFSNTLGEIALDGTVSNATTFDFGTDFDGLGAGDQGQIFSFDGSTASLIETIYSVDIASSSLSSVTNFSLNDIRLGDMYGIGTSLFGITRTDNRIYEFDLNSGNILGSVTINAPGQFNGLAPTIPSNPVPEPSTLLLLGSGLIGLVFFGRKKRVGCNS